MRIKNQQIVPIAFWVGFLALGLATGFAGHSERVSHKAAVAKSQSVKHQAAARATEAPAPVIGPVLARD